MSTLRSRKISERALLFCALSSLIAVSGFAQTATTTKKEEEKKDDVQKLEKFEVTGSRIKQVDLEGPSPIRVITRADIDNTGRSNLTELLRELPEASAIGINEGGTITAVRGATALDLRNLGPNNTLVIVNGRRVVLSGTNSGGVTFVDLNRYPLAMIERIEVLKDGASAIYGSDATAGVVNIILRKDYNGFELNASYGNTTSTDVAEKSISFFGGASNGKFRAMVSASFFSRNSLAATDRWFSSNADLTQRYAARGGNYTADALEGGWFDLRSGTGPQARISLLGGQVNGVNGINIPGLAAGTAITALPGTGGVLAGPRTDATPSFTNPVQTGTGGVFNAAAAATYVAQILNPGSSPSNLYNFQPWVWLVPSTDRRGMYSTFAYNITPTTEIYAEVAYQRNASETHLAPSPISTAGDNGITVPANNYWNPFGVAVSFNYRPTEIGPRIAKISSNTYSMLTGARGTVNLFGRPMDWDVGYYYGYDEALDTTENSAVSESRLRAALARTDSTALNIFGGPGFKNNPATIESIKVSSSKAGSAELTLIDARLSGTVAEIFSGDIGAAVLAEYREENFVEANDAVSTTLDDIIGQVRLADATSSFRSISSISGEVNIPLVKPAASKFLYKLAFRAAARFEKFSDGYDSGVKPGYGLVYQPFKSLVLRASYNETFRAPTLPQLYGGERQSLPNALPDYARPQALTGDPFDGSATQRLVKAGGNSRLTPENGKSKQFGMVWDLPFKYLEGLSVEATYGEISQENIITTVGTSVIRANEYSTGYEGLVVREPGTETYTNTTSSAISVYKGPGPRVTGTAAVVSVAPGASITVPGRISYIKDSYVNLAYQRIRFWDFGVRYNKKTTSYGRFSLRSSATYTEGYAFTRDRSVPLTNYVDRDGYPRFRVQSSIAWERKQWGAGLSHNYLPSYGVYDLDGYRTDNYQTYNAYLQYTIPDVAYFSGIRVTLGADNIFNAEPPLWYDGVGFDNSLVGRPQGSFYYLALKKSF